MKEVRARVKINDLPRVGRSSGTPQIAECKDFPVAGFVDRQACFNVVTFLAFCVAAGHAGHCSPLRHEECCLGR